MRVFDEFDGHLRFDGFAAHPVFKCFFRDGSDDNLISKWFSLMNRMSVSYPIVFDGFADHLISK